MSQCSSIVLLMCGLYFVVAADGVRGEVDWTGSITLKNNYVFSTGTEIDDKPVLQFWARGRYDNGLFIDLWTNTPLAEGNPNRSAEIDYTVGYEREFGGSKLALSLSYYDIQFPELFDNKNEFWSPIVRWSNQSLYLEVTYFYSQNNRDGYRASIGSWRSISPGWTLTGGLNFSNGPYANKKAVIGKLGIRYDASQFFFQRIGIELSDLLYKENRDDSRGFAATLSLTRYLFSD